VWPQTGKISDEISSVIQPVVTSCKSGAAKERGRNINVGMEKKVRLQSPHLNQTQQVHEIRMKKIVPWLLSGNKKAAYLERSMHRKASVCAYG